jgi:hypothetical protein
MVANLCLQLHDVAHDALSGLCGCWPRARKGAPGFSITAVSITSIKDIDNLVLHKTTRDLLLHLCGAAQHTTTPDLLRGAEDPIYG